jgi:hypothetical protein
MRSSDLIFLGYRQQEGLLVPFNAKVKETGFLFEAHNLLNSTSVVYELEVGKTYEGYIYPGYFDTAKDARGNLVYKWNFERQNAAIEAHGLEQLPTELAILDRRGLRAEEEPAT